MSVQQQYPHKHRPWWQIRWFAEGDTKEERQLIVKLDLLIVPYAFLAYWTKYIDQANISGFTLFPLLGLVPSCPISN